MELYQKLLSIAGVCIIFFTAQTMLFAADTATQDESDQLVPGYSEQYTFRVAGAPIGGQSATLSRIDNGQQTWVFTLDLSMPVDGQQRTFKQSGTFVVGSDGHAISFNSVSITNGVSQSEKVVFGARGATADFDPAIPGANHTFMTFGQPFLQVTNLVTPLSIATRAYHVSAIGGFLIPAFSATYLKQVAMTFKPKTNPNWAGRHFNVFDGTLSVPGQPDTTFEYWLSSSNGEIIRAINKSEKLEIVRN